MKTLHNYLVMQVIASLLLTVAVFTFVLLLGNVLKDLLWMIIVGHAGPGIIAEALVLLIPFVWVFALPMGLLTATLLVFGRFSADQELTAARASGISLLSLISPVLLLSLFCCALSAWFSMDLGPRSRVEFLKLRTRLAPSLAMMQIPEGRPINISTNYVFLTEKNDGGRLENITILCLDQHTTMWAPKGDVEITATNIVLNLYDARSITFPSNSTPVLTSFGKWHLVPANFDMVRNQVSQRRISDMTFWQLQDELHELQAQLPQTVSTNVSKQTVADVRKLPENVIEQIRVEMNRQIAFSFACFGFALVGIPLGIRVHRRETNIGAAIAIILVIVYYSFIMLGEELSFRPQFHPQLIVWLPNFLFQVVGAVLLWRANRGI